MTTAIPRNYLAELPAPPPDAAFRLVKVEKISNPHPYCITPKHVEVAADQFSGMLGEDAIRAAEKQGAKCDICRQRAKRGERILSFEEHENPLTLFVSVPNNRADLNTISGLHAYLLSLKPKLAELGIEGIAFPNAA